MQELLNETVKQFSIDNVLIRWMIDWDIPEVVKIEEVSSTCPRSYNELYAKKRRKKIVPLVAEINHRTVAFMFYDIYKLHFGIPDLTVHPEYRLRGIGRKMVTRLFDKFQGKRTRIKLQIRASNLPANSFYRALGFKATRMLRRHFPDTLEDAVEMIFSK